jgi:hypothetical protein
MYSWDALLFQGLLIVIITLYYETRTYLPSFYIMRIHLHTAASDIRFDAKTILLDHKK